MTTTTKRIFTGLALLFGLALTAFAQVNALDFAYGTGTVPPLRVIGGPYAAGVATLSVAQGYTTSASAISFNPLSTAALIRVGSGTSQESVTPSAVSCSTPAQYGTCNFTATFNNAHGTGDLVQSATYGAQEAINYQLTQGGGFVTINRAWVRAGGTSSIIAALNPSSLVPLKDDRGPQVQYLAMQPTTLTSLAVPATQTTSTVTFAGTGTWNGTYYVCITYIDALGGEGPCSASSAGLASGSLTIMSIAAPAASTGAVGWRAYAGATYAAAYLLPISSTSCTLSALETTVPACAITSAGTWSAVNVTTTQMRPNGQSPTADVAQTMPQGHTTFGYLPSAVLPVPYQSNFGPFPAFGSTTSTQYDIVGTAQLPPAYLNEIGRTIRVTGKLALNPNTAAVPTLQVALGWAGAGETAGVPNANICVLTGSAYGATALFNANFSCTMTVNALSTSATNTSGTIQGDGWLAYSDQATPAAGAITSDTNTAAIGTLALGGQDTIYVIYTSGSNTTTAVQLLDLHVETIQ